MFHLRHFKPQCCYYSKWQNTMLYWHICFLNFNSSILNFIYHTFKIKGNFGAGFFIYLVSYFVCYSFPSFYFHPFFGIWFFSVSIHNIKWNELTCKSRDFSLLYRLFWLLVVLGALCGLVFQLYRSTQKFIGHGTNTNLKYITEDNLDFPSVTLCNTNMFR